MYWLGTKDEERHDQCAHGGVIFTVESIRFAPSDDVVDEYTVSAAALFLLRTLTNDHTARNPVAEESQLFPHCGFSPYTFEGRFPVIVIGCNVGTDLEVVHSEGLVTIRAANGEEATVVEAEWADAVLGFVDEVQAFYDTSSARIPYDESPERESWLAFWEEWGERRAAALAHRPT